MEPKRNITSLKLTRIDALTDGVFAIAMTLRILEIRVPLTDLIHSETVFLAECAVLSNRPVWRSNISGRCYHCR